MLRPLRGDHFDAYVDDIRRDGAGAVSDYIDRYVRAHADWDGFLESVGTSHLLRQEEKVTDLIAAGARR